MKKLLIIGIMTNFAFATCPKISVIKKGESAKCSGFLISRDLERTMYESNEKRKLLEKITTKQDEHINTLDKQIVSMGKHNDYMYKRLGEEKDRSFWGQTIYFLSGVVLTGVIAVNVNR